MASERFLAAIAELDAGINDLVRLITTADLLIKDGEVGLSITLYKYWLLKNGDHPLRHVSGFNLGSQLLQIGDYAAARTYLGQAIEASPDFYPARLNLASAIERAGDNDAAVVELTRIIERLAVINQSNISHKVQAAKNIARIKRSTESAESALRQAIEIDASQADLVQHWFNRRQGRCVWPVLENVGSLTPADVLGRLAPLTISSYLDDPLLHLELARRYSEQLVKTVPPKRTLGDWPLPELLEPAKIHVAYLSSDFCNHAVGYLMSDVFENHNRNRYRISVFNIGEVQDDPIKQRIAGQVDHWEDIKHLSDTDAAKLIVNQGVDILIDMNGHTNYQRTGLLALKPAPVIANWLGYPGTMGSDVHHYIIADNFIIPPGYESFYSEGVLRLPCYQPNGKLFQVPQVAPSRAELGLPEGAFVFCCFNGSVKITEPMFSRWMRILAQVPNSVLWFRGSATDDFALRLRVEATARGISPDRLVFLSFRANTEYLACHAHADLFLDTFPYGAHTTASDALRMGVPIVTLAGLSFASRVCGSLSIAAGLPDLVCATPDEYEAKAVCLATNPTEMAAVRNKLAIARPNATLFDSPKLVRNLEQLFETMWQAYVTNSLPLPASDCGVPVPVLPAIPVGGNDILSFAAYQRRVELLGPEAIKRRPTATAFATSALR